MRTWVRAVTWGLAASATLLAVIERALAEALNPFWLPLIAGAWGIALAFAWRHRPLAGPCVALGSLLLGVGAAELVMSRPTGRSPVVDRLGLDGFFERDPVTGYRPTPNRQYHVKRYEDGALGYDVTYTIGPHGFRVTPEPHARPDGPCVLMFGGSFTFGEGIEDDETSSAVFSARTGARVHNFGLPGFGPHQMLALLETGEVDAALRCTPTLAIYQSMGGHVSRAAGRASYDRSGPRYVRRAGGHLERMGPHSEWLPLPASWARRVDRLLWQSALYRRWMERRPVRDLELFVAIVDAARAEVERRGARFEVAMWPLGRSHPRAFTALQEAGYAVHDLAATGPENWRQRRAMRVTEHDWHPSAPAHALVGAYLAERIVGGE